MYRKQRLKIVLNECRIFGRRGIVGTGAFFILFFAYDVPECAFQLPLLKTNNVDLVVLNDSPLLLTFNIIRDGIILKSEERERVYFETRIMSRYYDEQYYIDRHMKRTIERMAKGRLR